MRQINLKYFVIIWLSSISIIFSQSNKIVMVLRSAPKFTLQVNANYNQTFLDFNGTYNNDFHSDDFMKGLALGADKGFGASVTSKLAISESRKLRLDFSLSYNRVQSYLFGNSFSVQDNGQTSINMFTGGIGLEHNFTANHKFKIYLGGEANATLLNGSGTVWVENRGNPAGAYSYGIKISNSFRIGASVFGGSEYMLNNRVGVSLAFKYNFVNLLLKDAKQTDDPNSTTFPLRDKYDPNVRYSGNKNLAYISIMAGVDFYWGVTEKRYVINRY